MENIDVREAIVPELTEAELDQMEKELNELMSKKERNEDSEGQKEDSEDKGPPIAFPDCPAFPLFDRVKELRLDEHTEDESFYEDLPSKKTSFFLGMKNLPDSAAKKYYPEICRRFIECEKRIKPIENLLWNLPRTDRSLEEDRFEILGEVLDKACQGFEIWDEHLTRKIPFGHRLVLETRLLDLMNSKFDIIEKVCGEFEKLKGDQLGANNERDWLRYEIRHTDMNYVEIHEAMLLSYLDMPWFEILGEVLDKACQGFEIWDEHLTRKIPFGHRLVLETRLLDLMNSKFDIIEKVCGEFEKLKGDQLGANNERDWLRYEIRHTDMNYVEIHEAMLLSYLDMPW